MSKPPRPCVYCGRTGKRSREHIIADWVTKVIPQPPQYRSWAYDTTGNIQVGRSLSYARDPEFSEGALGQRKLFRVCEPCNNGWMKRIQDDAKPVLLPLIKGIWEGLSAEKTKHIANWATITTMNIHASIHEGSGSGVREEEFKAFFEAKSPLENWLIYIGRATGGDSLQARYSSFYARAPSSEPPTDKARNSQITTLQLEQLIIQVIGMPRGLFPCDAIGYCIDFGVLIISPVWGGEALNWRYLPFLPMHAVERLIVSFTNDF
jgi:hypothetical protein